MKNFLPILLLACFLVVLSSCGSTTSGSSVGGQEAVAVESSESVQEESETGSQSVVSSQSEIEVTLDLMEVMGTGIGGVWELTREHSDEMLDDGGVLHNFSDGLQVHSDAEGIIINVVYTRANNQTGRTDSFWSVNGVVPSDTQLSAGEKLGVDLNDYTDAFTAGVLRTPCYAVPMDGGYILALEYDNEGNLVHMGIAQGT